MIQFHNSFNRSTDSWLIQEDTLRLDEGTYLLLTTTVYEMGERSYSVSLHSEDYNVITGTNKEETLLNEEIFYNRDSALEFVESFMETLVTV